MKEQNLLNHPYYKTNQIWFEYLSNMCSEELKMIHNDGDSFFHFLVNRREAKDGNMHKLLPAALEHFPNVLGMLFQKDNQGGWIRSRSGNT